MTNLKKGPNLKKKKFNDLEFFSSPKFILQMIFLKNYFVTF